MNRARQVRVFDPPMCCSTGICGPSVDPKLVKFAADLNWLEVSSKRQRGTAQRRSRSRKACGAWPVGFGGGRSGPARYDHVACVSIPHGVRETHSDVKGVLVDRFNLSQQPAAFVAAPAVKAELERLGDAALPVVEVDGAIVSVGVYPSREELAAWTHVDPPEPSPFSTRPAPTRCC